MTGTFIYGLPPNSGVSAFRSTDDLYNQGGGNTGNFAFAYALSRLVGVRSVPWATPAEELAKMGDTAVIPAANNLGTHINLRGLADRLTALKSTKLVVAGLGAQSDLDGAIPELPKGSIDFLNEVRRMRPSNTPNVSLRGPFTMSVLEKYGFGGLGEVLGCPSLMTNPTRDLGKHIEQKIRPRPRRIAVAAGSFTRTEFRAAERILLRLVEETNGSYVGQHPQDMVHMTRGEIEMLKKPTLKRARDYMFPDMSFDDFKTWANRYGNVFFDIPSWMEHYRHFDLVIGMRIHGVMVALQAGVPAICVIHDSRTLELCQTMMIPYVDVRDLPENLSADNVMDLLKFDADAFDENRRMLASKYLRFFTRNGVKTNHYLRTLAKAD